MAAQSPNTFLLLPIALDETTKDVSSVSSSSSSSSSSSDPALDCELEALNALHRALKRPGITDGVPPPPVPVHPHRTTMIEKMRSTGNDAFRRQDYKGAVDLYSHAISMALTRPGWEPATILRDELQQLYSNRAQAHIGINNWPEALADANCSIEFKKAGNQKAHWRKCKCLKEMGRLEEARDGLEYGLEFGSDPELSNMLKEVQEMLNRRQ